MAIDLTAEGFEPAEPAAGVAIDRGPRNAVREFDEPVGWRRAGRYALLAAVSVSVLVCVLHPRSTAALAADEG